LDTQPANRDTVLEHCTASAVTQDKVPPSQTTGSPLPADGYECVRSLIESSPEPFLAIGIHGRIEDANLAAVKAAGRTRRELPGSEFADFFAEPAGARATPGAAVSVIQAQR
jgi:PAS domain-containing protein